MRGLRRAESALWCGFAILVALPARAQETPVPTASPQEARLLREAAALESRGSFRVAESRLRVLLSRYPGSAAGVFGLERVLRAQQRLDEVLPAADAYLEVEPRGQAVRYLKLRVLAELDSLDGLREATRAWIEQAPGSLTPYREAARIWERAMGPGPALELLEEGRAAVGSDDALAVSMGDLRARAGDPEGAVAEWSRAIGPEGANLSSVLRRLRELDRGSAELAAALADSLAAEPTTPDRLRAAVRVAVEAGLEDRALALGRTVLPELGERTRRGFLVDVSRRAEEGGLSSVALWAFETLRRGASTETEARSLDRKLVELSAAVGDSLRAARAQRRVARSLDPGTPQRRRALARLVRLRAGTSRTDEMLADMAAFRSEFPDAPELDLLGAEVARRFLVRGEAGAAADALEGIEGPLSTLERGYLALHDGRIREAAPLLRSAVDGLDPRRATDVVELVTLLGGVSESAGTVAAAAAVRAHRGAWAAAADTLVAGAREQPLDDRPALLAMAARMAERAGDPGRAAGIRSRMVEEFPDAPETPEAVVRLARHRAATGEGREEAVRLLERLIVNRPESAVVPEARRVLQRIRGEIPGGPGP